MTSRKIKAEILSSDKDKSQKPAKEKERKRCNISSAEYNVYSQNYLVKNKKTKKKLLVHFNSPIARKRRINEDRSSERTKINNISRSEIIEESVVISSSSSSDSDLIVISETESCLSERLSPFSDHTEGTKNFNVSELFNESEKISSVNVNVLHPSSFDITSPPSVPCSQLASKMSKSNISVIPSECGIDIKENDKHKSYHSTFSPVDVLSEIEFNQDLDFSSSMDSEKIFHTEIKSTNCSTDSNILDQNTLIDNTRQCTAKDSVECNSLVPEQSDEIMSLLFNCLNACKNSKENLICDQLKIEPVTKPVDFNYDQNNAFSIAVDISVLKAANDYFEENSSKFNDFTVTSSNRTLENSWQNSLIKSSDQSLNFTSLLGNDSNHLNSEDTESELSISSCNTADIQPDFFDVTYAENPEKVIEGISKNLKDYSEENVGPTINNLIQALDLNAVTSEIGNNKSQNLLCENIDLLNETSAENCIKSCAKVKKRRKKMNWHHRKRKCQKRNSTVPKANNLLSEEILCDTCEESELEENFDLVPPETCEKLLSNTYCLTSSPPVAKVADRLNSYQNTMITKNVTNDICIDKNLSSPHQVNCDSFCSNQNNSNNPLRKRNSENNSVGGGKITRPGLNLSDSIEKNIFSNRNPSDEINTTTRKKLKKTNKCSDNLIDANVNDSQEMSEENCRQIIINSNKQAQDTVNSFTVNDENNIHDNDCVRSQELAVDKKNFHNILKNKTLRTKSNDDGQLNAVKEKNKTRSTKEQKCKKKKTCTKTVDTRENILQTSDEIFCDTYDEGDTEQLPKINKGLEYVTSTRKGKSENKSDVGEKIARSEFTLSDNEENINSNRLSEDSVNSFTINDKNNIYDNDCIKLQEIVDKHFNVSLKSKTLMPVNNEQLNTVKAKSKRTIRNTKKQKYKRKEPCTEVKGNRENISQILVEEPFCDTFDENEQFSNNQKGCMSAITKGMKVNAYCKTSRDNLDSLLKVNIDSSSGQNASHPVISQKSYENYSVDDCIKLQELEVNKEHPNKTFKDKTLIVRLHRLDELTLKKYCKVFHVQKRNNKDCDSLSEQESSCITVDIGNSEPSCSNSKNVQNDVQLYVPGEVYQMENFGLNEKITSLQETEHPEVPLKSIESSKIQVITPGKESNISTEQKLHKDDDDSAHKEVDQNQNSEDCSDPIKSKVEESKLSSTKIDFQSKINTCRRKNESSKSLQHLKTVSGTGEKESKSNRSKNCVNKGNIKEQSSVKKSVNKLNSKKISSKISRQNCTSQSPPDKNFDLLNEMLTFNTCSKLNSKSTCMDVIRNMKPIPKLSHKKKTEKSHVNQGEDLHEDYSPQIKLAGVNNADLQSPSTQSSNLESNSNDILSCKLNDDINDTMILIDDECLDFEPDQSDDLRIKHSVGNSMIESSCNDIRQVNSEIPVSVQQCMTFNSTETFESDVLHCGSSFSSKQNIICNNSKEHDSTFDASHDTDSVSYPYNNLICSRNFCTPPEKEWLSEDDSDSDYEHSFKRKRYERKCDTVQESSVESVKENLSSTAVQNKIYHELEVEGPNEIYHAPISSVVCSAKSESFKSSSENQDTNDSKSDQTHCLKSKVSAGIVTHLKDVLAQIRDLCSKDLVNKAVETAKMYFNVSSSDAQKSILQVLLSSIFSLILKSDKNNNSSFKIFDDILNLIHDFKICDKRIASCFITGCCSHPDLNIFSKQLFNLCVKEKIPLNSKAVNAYNALLKLEEISVFELLEFFQYIKSVCNKKVSKELMHLALEKCESCRYPDIHGICKLLHIVTPQEVEEPNLKEFLLLCIKKDMWEYIAEMFIAWGLKNSLSLSVYTALAASYETMGKYFRKFAQYVHGDNESLSLHPELKPRSGQIGIALMLDAFSKGFEETALDILYTLHKLNVNYFELQLASGSSFLSQSSSETDTYDTKIFPFSVVFIAIDICLRQNRPKDAFAIFQDFSWVTPDESLDDAVRKYVMKERCQRLLKLVPHFLNIEDSLNKGWEALENLLTAIKQDSAQEIVQENIKDLVSIYNKYLIGLLNSEKVSLAYNLYEYSLGPRKDIFTVSPDVIRGLVVAFSQDGRSKVANSLFVLGVMKKIYPVEKPESFPWEITLMTHWTTSEIKVALEWFIGTLLPLLMGKPKETNFEKWFSVKISFNITYQSASDIEYLIETVSDSKNYVMKTKDALQSMNPSLEATEVVDENALCITSDSLYNFWKNKCPDAAMKLTSMHTEFVKHSKQFSFGTNGNCSKERESSVFVKTFFAETCTVLDSSEKIMKSQNSVESLQSLSPCELSKHSKSAESIVGKMLGEIRANTSKLPYTAITSEQSTSRENLVNGISSAGNCQSSEKEMSSYVDEKIKEFHQFQHLPKTLLQTNSTDRLIDPPLTDKSPKETLKNQQFAISDICYSSPNKNEILNSIHFQSPSKSNSKSSPLFSLAKECKSVNSKTSDSVPGSNQSPRNSSVCLNTAPGVTKSNNSQQKNSARKKAKFSPCEKPVTCNVPSVDVAAVNASFKSLPTSSLRRRNRRRKNTKLKKKLAALSVLSSNKLTASLKDSSGKSSTVIKNKMPVSTPELAHGKKREKLNKGSEKFENFTVCVTPSARTVNSPFSQSLPESASKTVQSNEIKLANIEKKDSSPFHDKIPVCNSPTNHSLLGISNNDIKANDTNMSNTEIKTSLLLPCRISEAKVNLVRLPVSNIQERKQELNELGTVSQAALKVTTSPSQSLDSVPKNKVTFSRTINRKNSNVESSNTAAAINISSHAQKDSQPRTSKPVIKRNFSADLNKKLIFNSTKDKIPIQDSSVVSASGATLLPFERSEKITDINQKFQVKREVVESSEVSRPVCGSTTHNDEEFNKIIWFLKMKVTLKNKNLSPEEQNKKALCLAEAFKRNNQGVTRLDKRSMKLLTEFANVYV